MDFALIYVLFCRVLLFNLIPKSLRQIKEKLSLIHCSINVKRERQTRASRNTRISLVSWSCYHGKKGRFWSNYLRVSAKRTPRFVILLHCFQIDSKLCKRIVLNWLMHQTAALKICNFWILWIKRVCLIMQSFFTDMNNIIKSSFSFIQKDEKLNSEH